MSVDLGSPTGSEAGFARPAVVVTAQFVLDQSPRTIQVVPLTTTLRQWSSEVELEPDETNGLSDASAAQCQHVRSVSVERLAGDLGNVGPVALAEVREVLADLLDL